MRYGLAVLLTIIIAALADDLVVLKHGSLRGHRLTSRKGRDIFAFQGIPYAKPPIGELRFKVCSQVLRVLPWSVGKTRDDLRNLTTECQRMRWVWYVARMWETRNAYRILVGKPEANRPLRRPRRRWVDNIKMNIREIGWDGINLIELVRDRDQWRGSCEHGDEPSGSLKLLGIS
jgi:hypothetical protein